MPSRACRCRMSDTIGGRDMGYSAVPGYVARASDWHTIHSLRQDSSGSIPGLDPLGRDTKKMYPLQDDKAGDENPATLDSSYDTPLAERPVAVPWSPTTSTYSLAFSSFIASTMNVPVGQ